MAPHDIQIQELSKSPRHSSMRALCITGMHRSGTSMVAKLLHACGISMGPEADLKLATRHNTAGHWENLAFVELNNDLLHQFGGDWYKPPMFRDGWEFSEKASRFVKNADGLLNQFRAPWGWKDPRNSLTLPFWLRLIPDLKVVVCLRNPLEVSRSLFLRDSQDPSPFDLWATHYRNIVSVTSPEQRLVTHYESYFANPRAELRRILDWLMVNVPNEMVERACAHVSADMRHWRNKTSQLLRADITDEVLGLYFALCAEAGPIYQQSRTRESDCAQTENDQLRTSEIWLLEKELIARREELSALKKECVNEIAALESDRRKLLEFRNQIVRSKFYKAMAFWWRLKRRKPSVPVAEMKPTFGDR